MRRVLAVALVFTGCGGDMMTGGECTVDTDCTAPHTACVDHAASRTCDCVAGYAMGSGGCAWSGVVDDPGFDQASTAWSGGTLNPAVPQTAGMQDPGVLVIENALRVDSPKYPCDIDVATRMITMPRRSRAEPLVLRETFQSQAILGHLPSAAPPLFRIGASRSVAASFESGARTAYATSRHCLGAAAYAPESSTGPGASLALEVSMECMAASSPYGVTFDHLDIAPATAEDGCPDPGPVTNGNAEGDGGWTFFASTTATAGFADGVGANQSRGVMLRTDQTCASAGARLPIWIPLADATGSPSLTLYHATPGPRFSLALAARDTDESFVPSPDVVPLTVTAGPAVDHYCLPSTTWGQVVSLEALLSGGPSCDPEQAVIDDVAIASDPACGSDRGFANAGFEADAVFNATATAGESSVAITADPDAHGGQRDLQLTVSSSCTRATYATSVVLPVTNPGEGPGATFWYKSAPGVSRMSVTDASDVFVPVRDGQWHQGVVCLLPSFYSRTQTLQVSLLTGESPCSGVAISPETLVVDDFRAISTPMCPAK